jgi:hypothetical protein
MHTKFWLEGLKGRGPEAGSSDNNYELSGYIIS